MTELQDILNTPVDGRPQQPRSLPSPPLDHEHFTSDKDEPLVGKAATGVQAPRPAYLTWAQVKEAEKDQPVETGSDTSKSGHVSPISPISSEALRTPSILERQKYSSQTHPSSPGATSQFPPRLHSPASQVFERDVQEDINPPQASPSIPAHIRTENHIPSVLEASSAAITDGQLNPDSVEIVTHSLHQPAAAGVAGGSTAEQSLASSGIVDHVGPVPTDSDDISSTHGASDIDVRRLSFISFADVVNAEHAETGESVFGRESFQAASVPGQPPAAGSLRRSPSPLRSPASSFKGLEMPSSHTTIETMRQALRRTGSGDLTCVANHPVGAIENDESLDHSF
ncbi:hypothetical protein PENDEC_c013G04275 [Penicillium decumbens]|uniref:Uncharacterized protein n=1 Tax=Penicillium decumbens TaxID=69771 RepID=A0A1V6PAW9_PENDC|nr:hypothetical protein PENDEC_c013G04275 [Penicillium decumbens]